MTTSKNIHWGILGCGKIAHKFVSDLLLSENSVLYACASRDVKKAKSFADQYNAVTYYDSYEDMAQCKEIDVIYVATPHAFHHDHSILCMKNGKHVLCEKPLGINKNQVLSMIDVAKTHKVFLMEAMWTAFLPTILDIQKTINAGTIGEIRHLTADFGFLAVFDPNSRLFNPSLAGGSLLDVGIYPIFISIMAMGMPSTIQTSATLSTTGVDSECNILLTYSNGSSASLYSSITCHTDTKCEIYGTKGKITIPGRFHEARHYFLKKDDLPEIKCEVGRIGFGYFHEIEHVKDCITKGIMESDTMHLEISKHLVALMDEVRRQIGVSYPIDDE